MVMLQEGCWWDCCTIFHQDTELSHTYLISLSLFLFSFCVVFPQVLAPSSQAIPSRRFLPFFHPSGIHVCFFFFLIPTSLSLLLSELRTVPLPLCRVHLLLSCLPFLSSSPLSLSLSLSSSSSLVVSSSISPSSFLVDSCLSRGNPFIHPSQLSAPLCLPSCLSVCSVCGSERTGGGVRRQEWANRQLSSQMLLSVLPVLLLFCSLAFSLCISSSWPPLHVAMQAPCLLVSKRREGSEERLGEKECGMESRR